MKSTDRMNILGGRRLAAILIFLAAVPLAGEAWAQDKWFACGPVIGIPAGTTAPAFSPDGLPMADLVYRGDEPTPIEIDEDHLKNDPLTVSQPRDATGPANGWHYENGVVGLALPEGRFVVDARITPVDFSIADGSRPQLAIKPTDKLEGRRQAPILPAGATFEATLAGALPPQMKTLAPVEGYPSYAPGNGIASSNWYASGAPGDRINVVVSKPGLELESTDLHACLVINETRRVDLGVVELAEISGSQGGFDLTLEIPKSAESDVVLPWHRERLIVVAADGRFGAATEVTIARVGPSLFVAWLPILGIYYWMSVRARDRHKEKTGKVRSALASLFLGRTGKASVAQFQMWLWTFLIAGSVIYVFLVTGELFAVTPTALVLLGFAGGGSLGARTVAMGRQERAYKLIGADGAPKFTTTARFSDLFTTSGRVDLFKFQILAFTLIIAAYVFLQVLATSAFPDIPESMLMLMGISNGVYVVSKTGGTTAFGVAETKSVQLEVSKSALADDEEKQKLLLSEEATLTEKKAKLEKELKDNPPADPNDLADKQDELKGLEKELADKGEEKTELEKKVSGLKTNIANLTTELNELLKKLSAGST